MIDNQKVKIASNNIVSSFALKHVSRVAGIVGAALLLLMTAGPTSAVQSITVHGDVSLTATASDFNAGEKQQLYNNIQWSSDTYWIITVKSLNADLGQSDDLSYTKPLSDLEWKLSGPASWKSMTTTDATVKLGSAGSGSFNVDYTVLLSWANDKKGNYSATIQYTIAPN